MARRFKIRRNLAKGAEYGFLQISESDTNSKLGATIAMVDPSKYSIEMYDCILWNVKGTAQKIFEGAYKERCAWIVCDSFEVVDLVGPISDNELAYDPRLAPHWLDNDLNDVDKTSHEIIVSSGVQMYRL